MSCSSRSDHLADAPIRRSQSEVGKLIASESQGARDCQQVSIVGDEPGSL
jgi:hypothetical protein